MALFLNPKELKKITDDAEMAELKAAIASKRRVDQAAEDLKQAFQAREIAPETPERINKAIQAAAQRGEHEVLVLRFPASYCNDRGRRINNFEGDWPKSLEGFGKTAFEYFEKELEPLGFSMRAEIMDFPGGNLGDVGMYLRW